MIKKSIYNKITLGDCAMSDEEKQKIKDFVDACNDMIEGRFILSDTKVSNILKCVVKSEIIYGLYSACVKNFKFSAVLQECSASNPNNTGHFVMPKDPESVVAFVTCLLLEVDKQSINLQKFVSENFYNVDGYNISYNNFALTVLVPYRDAVLEMLNMNEQGEENESKENVEQLNFIPEPEETPEADNNTKLLFANLLMSINELQTAINEDVKIKFSEKEELLIVLRALAKAVKLEELLIINALLVPLEHVVPKHKKLKPIYDNIKIHIADIYY